MTEINERYHFHDKHGESSISKKTNRHAITAPDDNGRGALVWEDTIVHNHDDCDSSLLRRLLLSQQHDIAAHPTTSEQQATAAAAPAPPPLLHLSTSPPLPSSYSHKQQQKEETKKDDENGRGYHDYLYSTLSTQTDPMLPQEEEEIDSESIFEINPPSLVDFTNSLLPHFHMMETSFSLKPEPISGFFCSTSAFDNTPVSIQPEEEKEIPHDNKESHLTSTTTTTNSMILADQEPKECPLSIDLEGLFFNYGEQQPYSEEQNGRGNDDDSFSFTNSMDGVTVEEGDIKIGEESLTAIDAMDEIEPLELDTGKIFPKVHSTEVVPIELNAKNVFPIGKEEEEEEVKPLITTRIMMDHEEKIHSTILLSNMQYQHMIDDDQLFDLNIKALRAFKAKYGHCRVSQEQHVYLHRWCEHIRKTYGHMCSGKLESKSLSSYKAITDTQHQQLQEIGFEFFSGGRAPKSFKEKRLNSLKEFRSKFGHCKVPKRYKEDKGLGPWCCEMRHSYKLIKEGKKPRSILTMDMYEDLESLGFAWTV